MDILKEIFQHPLLLSTEVEQHDLEVLERMVSEGTVGCKTIESCGIVYWMKNQPNTDLKDQDRLSKLSPSSVNTPLKRNHPNKFVSPLLSSPNPIKCPRLTPPPPMHRSMVQASGNPGNPSGDFSGSGDSMSPILLTKEIKLLEEKVKEKEDEVRKLKMIKLYRTKNDLRYLDTLIGKWRQASQEGAETLLVASTREPHPTMTQLLDYLQIDHTLIHYSPEDEAFY